MPAFALWHRSSDVTTPSLAQTLHLSPAISVTQDRLEAPEPENWLSYRVTTQGGASARSTEINSDNVCQMRNAGVSQLGGWRTRIPPIVNDSAHHYARQFPVRARCAHRRPDGMYEYDLPERWWRSIIRTVESLCTVTSVQGDARRSNTRARCENGRQLDVSIAATPQATT